MALERLQWFLKSKGASVYIIRLEPGPQGAKVGSTNSRGGRRPVRAPGKRGTRPDDHGRDGALRARGADRTRLCALPDPPDSDELLGPLVARGSRLVLGGHTGEGKTTLALQLVRAIVLGEELARLAGRRRRGRS